MLTSSCTSSATRPAIAGTGTTNAASVPLIRLAAGPDGYPSPITGRRLAGIQASLMFDTLVWKDSTGSIIGWLAASWDRSSDGTEWSFHLHDGVKFQDGTALTAADVAFSYNYFISGPALAGAGRFGSVFIGDFVDVVATTPDTVVFHLKRPWTPFLQTIAALIPILPQHIWASVTNPATFSGPQSVVGSGPYRLQSFDRATGNADFVANDTYFLGRPIVRRIEFVPAPDQLLALARGDIDAADAGTEDQLPTQALSRFTSSKYGTVTGPSDWTRALHFNLNKGFPYDNVQFRQAIDYAVDRKDLVKRILFGRGLPGSSGWLAPSAPDFAPGLPAYDHDVATAETLLDQAGLKVPAGGGMRTLPGGQPFAISLQTSSEYSAQTAQLVSEYLRQVGLRVDIQTLDPTTADSDALKGNYDMALIGYSGVGNDPDLLLRIGLSPAAIPVLWKAWGYNNATVNALGLQQLFTADDTTRAAGIGQIQHLVANDVPLISLYLPTPEEIYNKKVFSAWYFTPGGFLAAGSGVLNKQVFVTARKTGA
jgi:peptide/nickel transport system substrate-binding protein